MSGARRGDFTPDQLAFCREMATTCIVEAYFADLFGLPTTARTLQNAALGWAVLLKIDVEKAAQWLATRGAPA